MIDKETYKSSSTSLLTATENPLPSPIFSIPYQIPNPIYVLNEQKYIITSERKKVFIPLQDEKSSTQCSKIKQETHNKIRLLFATMKP